METRLASVRRVRPLRGASCVLEVDGPIPATWPGQLYMLRTAECWPVLVPRPFSLYDRAPDGSYGGFLVKPIGPGTRALAACRPGQQMHWTGPLGRPFPAAVEDPVCIAGGVGLAPFLLLARQRAAAGRDPVRLLFGGRDREGLAGAEDFAGIAKLWTATEDGAEGFRGRVDGLLKERLRAGEVSPGDSVLCCGPEAMMRAVALLCAARGMRCWLSLEPVMACGYGVCNGCTVEVVPARFGGWPYSRACQEGPVYEAADLPWSARGAPGLVGHT